MIRKPRQVSTLGCPWGHYGTLSAEGSFTMRNLQVVQNKMVAAQMKRVFRTLQRRSRKYPSRPDPENVAKTYGELMRGNTENLVDQKRLSRSRFYVGLSIDSGSHGLNELTKRATLVSDTLLLSHHWTEGYHYLGETSWDDGGVYRVSSRGGMIRYGIHCPSLAELGQWILDAEPLLRAGLAWYLPNYSITKTTDKYKGSIFKAKREVIEVEEEQVKAIDYLIRDGRAVDASGAEPIKSQLVRPVLHIDLPFIEGVKLAEFSKITIEEFSSYSGFRDFLRQSFLDMDMSLNSVQSDRELLKLGLRIKDQVRLVRSEMQAARRNRAVSATGAVVGSVGAILVAVHSRALEAAIAAIGVGASGVGMWGIIEAATKNSTRALREDKWYYVWTLAKKSNVDVS